MNTGGAMPLNGIDSAVETQNCILLPWCLIKLDLVYKWIVNTSQANTFSMTG